MKVTLFNYDGKGDRIAAALTAAGHQLVDDDGDVALVDHDVRSAICDRHEKVAVYPHGGNPVLDWDGHYPIHPHIRLQLTHSRGHAAVLEAAGYPVRCEPVGWCYSDLAEPRYPARVRRVLFAPEHAAGSGYLPPEFRHLNVRIFEQLRELDSEITVRVWRDRDGHGLPVCDDVTWTHGGTPAHTDIDAADVVVAVGTVAHLAAARGAPLIMFGSDVVPDLADGPPPINPAHWDECLPLLRYPVDFDDADLDVLLKTVTQPDDRISEWRQRFVEPFDPEKLVRLVEELAA